MAMISSPSILYRRNSSFSSLFCNLLGLQVVAQNCRRVAFPKGSENLTCFPLGAVGVFFSFLGMSYLFENLRMRLSKELSWISFEPPESL